MNDEELLRWMIDEIPEPGPNYWQDIDRSLIQSEMSDSAATDIEVLPDITALEPKLRRRLPRWPLAAAAAIGLVFAGWLLGARILPQDGTTQTGFAQDPLDLPLDARPGPQKNLDHWNAVYAVWDCTAKGGDGDWIPPFQSSIDDTGIHSHGDGLISIHPFFDASSGENATFSHFADAMGITLRHDSLMLGDGTVMQAGATCDGEPAVLQMLRWEFDLELRRNPAIAPRVILEDFGAERFYNNREVWTIALAPIGAEIPLPSDERFQLLDNFNGANPLDSFAVDSDPVQQARSVPFADLYVSAQPGMGADPLAQDLLAIRQQQVAGPVDSGVAAPIPGSVRHVATLQSGQRLLDLFRFEASGEFPNCYAIYSAEPSRPGGLSTCISTDLETGFGLSLGATITSIHLVRAPTDSEWMVVLTSSGTRVATAVIDGIAYAEWATTFGEPTDVTLLDARLNSLWSSTEFG